jgi:uncharacterized tellurite resistance protein B-like protein
VTLPASLRRLLGVDGPRAATPPAPAGPVGAIVAALRDLPAERARFVAAFAMVLARGARSDLRVSEDEARVMTEVVAEVGGLELPQAALVVAMATHASELAGASADYVATRELAAVATPDERRRVVECLFAVAAADDSVTLVEEEEIRQVASELGLDHRAYTAARARVRDQREVLRSLGRR